MSQYYFLVASLPYLTYETTGATAPDEFLELARQHLSEAAYDVLASATIEAPVEMSAEHPTLAQWQQFDRGVRNALVKARAGGPENLEYVRADSEGRDFSEHTGLAEVSREVVASESPLAGEHLVGRLRWGFLGELETGHFFDLTVLIVYYLKLQLLARNRLFARDDGERVFISATEKIMNEYYQEQGDV